MATQLSHDVVMAIKRANDIGVSKFYREALASHELDTLRAYAQKAGFVVPPCTITREAVQADLVKQGKLALVDGKLPY